MPKVVVVAGKTPVSVEVAARVFHSTLRMHLLRHYLATPGPQKDAIAALGITQRVASVNLRELVDVGVLVEERADDRRSQIYRVDVDRVGELLGAISHFVLGPEAPMSHRGSGLV